MTNTFNAKTKYFNARRATMLVLHGTAVEAGRTHKILSGETDFEVSCPYAIFRDGRVEQYLDPTIRAWHAGLSYWSGFTDINSMSLGIEIECISASETFTEKSADYTDAQITATIALVKQICAENKIAPHHIVAHQDIAPYRKADPGVNFPWKKLAEAGIGLWHDLEPVKNDAAHTDADTVNAFKEKLALYGYDTRAHENQDFASVIRAFQTHFLPWNICGQVTEQSVKALDILLEKKCKI